MIDLRSGGVRRRRKRIPPPGEAGSADRDLPDAVRRLLVLLQLQLEDAFRVFRDDRIRIDVGGERQLVLERAIAALGKR